MFNVGDFVVGKHNNGYGITNNRALCQVISKSDCEAGGITVLVIACVKGNGCPGATFPVNQSGFVETAPEEFIEKFPDCLKISNWEEITEICNTNKTTDSESQFNENVHLCPNSSDVPFMLTDDERATLRGEMRELLQEYEYGTTFLDKIIDEWAKNKGWLIRLMEKHPNYNGKYQIAFDRDFERKIEQAPLNNFVTWARDQILNEKVKPEFKINCCTLSEAIEIRDRLDINKDCYWSLLKNNVKEVTALYSETCKEYEKWNRVIDRFCDIRNYASNVVAFNSNHVFELKDETYNMFKFYNFLVRVLQDPCQFVDESLSEYTQLNLPKECNGVTGQKTSRLVRKVCKFYGLTEVEGFESEFAKFSDAINPLAIKRHTILSAHPNDYYTMSFGNSWTSCHTIDKRNIREYHGGNHYQGCYSSGTESYMLDGSSLVFYTVDKDYDGDYLELEPKINRCMFHLGEDKIVQGRVYPQANDGESGLYKEIREIVQKVVADCLGATNSWKNIKGTDACSEVVSSEGTHYRDYTNYSNCNVSYLKPHTDNEACIVVGHDPICPNCGTVHDYEEAIECSECWSNETACAECGCYNNIDDMREIGGEYYCDECCFYCDYHGEYEPINRGRNYVQGYGNVCDSGIGFGNFYRCEWCDTLHLVDDEIVTDDGYSYCSESCAENAGYHDIDGTWYRDDDCQWCENCERYVLIEEDWNEDLEMCNECASRVTEASETSEENETEIIAEAIA